MTEVRATFLTYTDLCQCVKVSMWWLLTCIAATAGRMQASASPCSRTCPPAWAGASVDRCSHHRASAGVGSSWHLSRVEVYNEATDETAVFNCNAWFDATSGDGAVERVFYVSSMPSLVSAHTASVSVAKHPHPGWVAAARSGQLACCSLCAFLALFLYMLQCAGLHLCGTVLHA